MIPTFLLHAHAHTQNLIFQYTVFARETCQDITSKLLPHCHSCYCCTFTYHMSYMICMFLFNLCTNLHIPILNCSFVVTMKLKRNKNFHTANMLLFYIPLKYYLKKVPYFSKICYHIHFRDLKQVALMLLLLHLVGIRCPHTPVKTGQLLQKFIQVRGGPMDKQMNGQVGRWANTQTCMHMQYGDFTRLRFSSGG